jgi:protein TonB
VDADALSHTAVPAPSPFVENPDCGGAEALQEYVKNHPPEITWPWTATEGRVLVEFLVTEEGEVISPKIMRGVNEPLNAAALRAVNSLECEPGLKEDKPVLVQKSLLVTFRDE